MINSSILSKEPTFPRLRISYTWSNKEVIVLCTKINTEKFFVGFVVYSENPLIFIGEYSNSWEECSFIDYKKEVTLKNSD